MKPETGCRARVILKAGLHAPTMAQALAVESKTQDSSTPVTVERLSKGRVQLTIRAPRPSLLRAALKAYLQWAACCHQVSLRSESSKT